MKRILFSTVVFFILCYNFYAQQLPGWKLFIGAEALSFKNQELLIEQSPNAFKAEKYISNYAELGVSTSFHNPVFEKVNTPLFRINPVLNIHFRKNEINNKLHLDPFVFGGLGLSKFDKYTDTYWEGGGGLNIWFNRRLGLQYQASVNNQFSFTDKNSASHSFGIFVNLNSKLNDADKDGIADTKDKCKWVKGTKDNSGCPDNVSIASEFIDKDSPQETNVPSSPESITDEVVTKKDNVETNTIVDIVSKEKIDKSEKQINTLESTTQPNELALPDSKIVETENIVPETKEQHTDEVITVIKGSEVTENINDEFDNNTITNNTQNNTSNIKSVNNQNDNFNSSSILNIATVYFDLDEYDILDTEKTKIHFIIYELDNTPGSHILLEGHTSPDGDIDYNKVLSFNRANSVKTYLVDKGVDPDKIKIKDYIHNSHYAIDTDPDELAKALDRKVNIILLRK